MEHDEAAEAAAGIDDANGALVEVKRLKTRSHELSTKAAQPGASSFGQAVGSLQQAVDLGRPKRLVRSPFLRRLEVERSRPLAGVTRQEGGRGVEGEDLPVQLSSRGEQQELGSSYYTRQKERKKTYISKRIQYILIP